MNKGGLKMSVEQITSFAQCVSREERKLRFFVTLTNLVIWGIIGSIGIGLLYGFTQDPAALTGVLVYLVLFMGPWLVSYLLAEYNVRKLWALGASVSDRQFPAVREAANAVQQRFQMKEDVRIIILSSGEANAFAIKFARKRVVVIFTELLEGIIDNPEELRALLAHEMCHVVLDHGWRGTFELRKPKPYQAARELTCDNAGYVAAGDVEATKTMLRKLCAGYKLHRLLSDETLAEEAVHIYSGFAGWLIRRYLSHPPFGKRIQNVHDFATEVG